MTGLNFIYQSIFFPLGVHTCKVHIRKHSVHFNFIITLYEVLRIKSLDTHLLLWLDEILMIHLKLVS